MKTDEQIKNCVVSELTNFLYDFESENLDKETILLYVSTILLDANVNPDIVIKILEDDRFGIEGKNIALNIKVNLGY